MYIFSGPLWKSLLWESVPEADYLFAIKIIIKVVSHDLTPRARFHTTSYLLVEFGVYGIELKGYNVEKPIERFRSCIFNP